MFRERKQNISDAELRKTPITPTEGMEFADDYFFPRLFHKGRYHVYLKHICDNVRNCTPIESAFKIERISRDTFFRWKRIYAEEVEMCEGTNYTTPLIMFFDAVYEAESSNEQQLAKVLFDTAVNDLNTDSAKYLLDKRHKWKETKAVEVDTAEDKGIEINITPMEDSYEKPNDEGE